MKYPKVVSVEHVKTIHPNMSSGTGYSEPNVFEFKLDTGESIIKVIDVWYCPKDIIVKVCRDCCYELPIMNPMETLEMILEYYKSILK